MGRSLLQWSVFAALALLGCLGCGGRDNTAQLTAPGVSNSDSSNSQASGFKLTVAPETFAEAEPVDLSLDVAQDEDGVIATITAPADAELNALCARIDYDPNEFTASEVEWLADFSQGEDCLKLTQLAIEGKAYLGCIPVGDAKAECGGILARVHFQYGGCIGKGASAVVDQEGLISNEILNLTESAIYWDTDLIAGDYDENGEIGFAELTMIGQHYLERASEENGYVSYETAEDGTRLYIWQFNRDSLLSRLDYQRDGEINQADLLGISDNFGKAITEWRIYSSVTATGYPTYTRRQVTSVPYAARDKRKTNNSNYCVTIPEDPEILYLWIRPWTYDTAGPASRSILFTPGCLDSIQLEYDEEAMRYYGGVPPQTDIEFWYTPDHELIVECQTSGWQETSSADYSLYIFNMSFEPQIYTPWFTHCGKEKPAWKYSHFNIYDFNYGVNLQSIEQKGSIACYGCFEPFNAKHPAGFTVNLYRTKQKFTPNNPTGILDCSPFEQDTATTTWDPATRVLSWLYNGHADCNQDGWCNNYEDSTYPILFEETFWPIIYDETSFIYLADVDHNGMLDDRDELFTKNDNHAHDGYNMYYSPSSFEVNDTYAGHVALSEGVGNRFLERLRFSFQYPPEVQPGDRLYYRPTLNGEEGDRYLLYIVPDL